jgi:hypothetical protein
MAREKRKLTFICIKHPNTVEMIDGGYDRDGETESSERQQVRRVLEKRFILPDGRSVPMFALAKEPQRLNVDDKFDADLLTDRNTGSYSLPSAAWLQLREDRLAVAAQKRRSAEGKADEILQHRVVDAVTALIGARDGDGDSKKAAGGKKGGAQ